MTKQEKIIVSAYTGVLMCDFVDLQEYIEKKIGRPVFTHELADEGIQKEVKEKSKEDFLEICNREEPERKTGQWLLSNNRHWQSCSECGADVDVSMGLGVYVDNDEISEMRFCPNCGADMRGESDE